MKSRQLHDFFAGVSVKTLSGVDTNLRSNQHEVGTTVAMRRQFLGEQKAHFQTIYVWLGEDNDALAAQGTTTHYDARAQSTTRSSEWRLYYRSNPVTESMQEGDTLFLAQDKDRQLYFIITPKGSTSEQQLSWLFNLTSRGTEFVSREVVNDTRELGFAARFILDQIGIQFEDAEADSLDAKVEHFDEFPRTHEFSALARETLAEVDARDDPDGALIAWLNHEESLFRRLERRLVASRLEKGFQDDSGLADVDGFIQFSLSVQNRRKSRMGRALEHHLKAVFDAHDVAYAHGAATENNQRPDFLFPSVAVYQAAPEGGSASLTMLAAKSSCKERWRQVLAEAAKIPNKHLLTLEPGISEPQTDQMAKSHLQLVVPESIQVAFTKNQREWLWTLRDFIEEVRRRAL